MNAIELANKYYTTGVMSAVESAEMLRRQHEAIVKLRVALSTMKAHATHIESKVGYLSTKRKQEVCQMYNSAEKALKDSEDLK